MNNINESYSISSLTKDEVKTLLESLLFSSSVDVCASFYKQETLNMFELAKKIRIMFPEIILDDINIVAFKNNKDEDIFHDEHTQEIVKFFPEIVKDIKE